MFLLRSSNFDFSNISNIFFNHGFVKHVSKVLERLLGRLLRFFSSLSVGLCRPFIISLFEPWQHFHWFLNLADNEVRIRCSLSSVETPNCRSAVELCFWQKDFWWEFQSEKGQHDMSKFNFWCKHPEVSGFYRFYGFYQCIEVSTDYVPNPLFFGSQHRLWDFIHTFLPEECIVSLRIEDS